MCKTTFGGNKVRLQVQDFVVMRDSKIILLKKSNACSIISRREQAFDFVINLPQEVRNMSDKVYIAIDLKSYYASVECVQRGLNPLTTNLVVADPTRTDKTICLAVTPSLKAYGISGRARLFEVNQGVADINRQRMRRNPSGYFTGSSCDDTELNENSELALDFIIAPPQMALYQKISAQIVDIYLRHVSEDDIHVYSIDEVFIDVTPYLSLYKMTAHQLAVTMIRDVLKETGITATVGIGTNMFLAKVAMDIVAKKMPADKDGVRIAELDERKFRELLWNHRPLTAFWHIGSGSVRRLNKWGMYTLGDVCRMSEVNEDLLYKEFGVNAEILIDHAWGYDPVTILDIKMYKPKSHSLNIGQVLMRPYEYGEAQLVIKEMADMLSYDLVRKRMATEQLVVWIGYDKSNATDPEIMSKYKGQMGTDWYGRTVPQGAHGSIHIGRYTSSSRLITRTVELLFEKVADPNLRIRRLGICGCDVLEERELAALPPEQIDFFTDYSAKREEEKKLEREYRKQRAVLGLRERYGKNSVILAMNLLAGATTVMRNQQIGGHRA